MIRRIFIGILVATAIATLWAVFAQQRQLENLRAEQQRLQAEIQSPAAAPVQTASTESPRSDSAPSSELLRLRSQVSQLTQRKRELATLPAENDRLRTQVATRSTNVVAGKTLPPGYIRKSQAQNVGYNTPEDTLQSFLWAIQNRDTNGLMQAMMPETVQKIAEEMDRHPGEMWNGLTNLPGMHVLDRQPMPDGGIELRVEIMPGEPMPQPMRFHLVNGQWKMDFN